MKPIEIHNLDTMLSIRMDMVKQGAEIARAIEEAKAYLLKLEESQQETKMVYTALGGNTFEEDIAKPAPKPASNGSSGFGSGSSSFGQRPNSGSSTGFGSRFSPDPTPVSSRGGLTPTATPAPQKVDEQRHPFQQAIRRLLRK